MEIFKPDKPANINWKNFSTHNY